MCCLSHYTSIFLCSFDWIGIIAFMLLLLCDLIRFYVFALVFVGPQLFINARVFLSQQEILLFDYFIWTEHETTWCLSVSASMEQWQEMMHFYRFSLCLLPRALVHCIPMPKINEIKLINCATSCNEIFWCIKSIHLFNCGFISKTLYLFSFFLSAFLPLDIHFFIFSWFFQTWTYFYHFNLINNHEKRLSGKITEKQEISRMEYVCVLIFMYKMYIVCRLIDLNLVLCAASACFISFSFLIFCIYAIRWPTAVWGQFGEIKLK